MKFVAFRTMMANEIGDSQTRMLDLILQWTNLAYHQICRASEWSWLEGTATITQALGDDDIPLEDTTYKARRALSVVDMTDNPSTSLDYKGEAQFWGENYDSTLTGDPELWRVWAGSIYLWPIPSSARTLQLQYIKLETDLNATDNAGLGTDILIPDSLIQVLYDGVLSRAMRYLDDNREQAYLASYRERLQAAKASDRRDQGVFERSASRQRAVGLRLNGTHFDI